MHILYIAFMLAITSPIALAINVVPFSGELDLSQSSSYKIKVNNQSRYEAAVKISVFKWVFDENGKERREATNDLIVFPKQMLIKANGSRHVRISLRRGTSPKFEKAYRIIVEELPIEQRTIRGQRKGASINILTRYVTSFYVKPVNAFSKVTVTESSATRKGFRLGIRNTGNAHTHFIEPSMTISQHGYQIEINDVEALSVFSRTNLLATSFRIYDWSIPSQYKSELDLDQPFDVAIRWKCENCIDNTDGIDFQVTGIISDNE